MSTSDLPDSNHAVADDAPESDRDAAVEAWRKSAAEGSGTAKFRLGLCYFYGYGGIPKDTRIATFWWKQALEQLNIEATQYEDAEAQFWLGHSCKYGRGAPVNPEQAAHWFQKAANGGHAGAYYSLGKCYQQGCGVEKDPVKAKELMEKGSAAAAAAEKEKEVTAAKPAEPSHHSGLTNEDHSSSSALFHHGWSHHSSSRNDEKLPEYGEEDEELNEEEKNDAVPPPKVRRIMKREVSPVFVKKQQQQQPKEEERLKEGTEGKIALAATAVIAWISLLARQQPAQEPLVVATIPNDDCSQDSLPTSFIGLHERCCNETMEHMLLAQNRSDTRRSSVILRDDGRNAPTCSALDGAMFRVSQLEEWNQELHGRLEESLQEKVEMESLLQTYGVALGATANRTGSLEQTMMELHQEQVDSRNETMQLQDRMESLTIDLGATTTKIQDMEITILELKNRLADARDEKIWLVGLLIGLLVMLQRLGFFAQPRSRKRAKNNGGSSSNFSSPKSLANSIPRSPGRGGERRVNNSSIASSPRVGRV